MRNVMVNLTEKKELRETVWTCRVKPQYDKKNQWKIHVETDKWL